MFKRISFLFPIIFICIGYLPAQTSSKNSLRISYGSQFKFDSVYISYESEGSLIRRIIPYKSQLIKLSFKSDKMLTGFSCYFKGNNYNLNDTFYFESAKRNWSISISDSLTYFSEDKLFRLRNLYNFQELYSRYIDEAKYYENISPININSANDNLANRKLLFIKENLKNPYIVDLFSIFVVNDRTLSYNTISNFVNEYLIPIIESKNTLEYIATAVEGKKITSLENITTPNFLLQTMEDKIISSKNLNGKYLLLNFWATWCVPCRAELPALKQMFQKFDSTKITMVSISLDRDKEILKKFIFTNKLDWNHVYNDRRIIGLFHVNPIPQTILIDPKGIIVYNSLLRKDEDSSLSILSQLVLEKIQ